VTGSGSDTTNTTVTAISPANSQTGVPINTQVTAVMSDDIDPTTVTNSSITLKQGSTAIAGTVTLASDGVTLTFVPTSSLPASALLYNVSVGGFKDTEGNTVTTFNSSGTTGTTGYGNGSFALVSTTPANNATGVSVTSPVTFTMSNLINPASVNPSTVFVYDTVAGAYVAGSYTVNGNTVTFTPLTQYPGNTLMYMGLCNLTDEAANSDCQYWYQFTTANTADTTAPTVTITPANGTTNTGLNTQVVLTFSKSINPATINAGSVNLLNGDVPLNPATSISRDNRTVVLNYNGGTLPAGATITVTATHLVTDLSGNALADTTSQFTTTAAVSNSALYVISTRPGNGATVVPTNTVITLFTTAPMNAGTIPGALHITQNGVVVSGTINVGSTGQSIEFTPGSALTAGTVTQVFLDSTAQDIYGHYLSNFSSQFTPAGSPTNTAALVQAFNPFQSATNVPQNTVIQVAYDQPLLASTINSTNVVLYQYSSGTFLTPTLSLAGGGQVINIAPTSNLTAGQYFAYVCYGGNVTNTDGVPVQGYELNFTVGSVADTAAPTISSVAPPDSSANIGTNAGISVNFNKAINPVSVTGSSIQLSGSSVTEVPSSISFTTDYTRTIIIPQAPLPSNRQMAIAISGVTSEAGVAVATLVVAQQATSATDKNPPPQESRSPQKPDAVSTSVPAQHPNSGIQASDSDSPGRAATMESALDVAKNGTSTERTRAVDVLGEARSVEAIPDLSNILLKSGDASLREHSATSLGHIADPSSVPVLVEALSNDPATSVSVSAAEALGRIGGRQAETALLQESKAARPVEVRAAAVRALGSAKADESAQALRAYTHDPVPEVRYAAVDGLVRQQSRQATAAIIEVLGDHDPNVAQRAAWALGELRDEAAITPLLEELQSRGPVAVRRTSALALSRIGDPRVAFALNRSALDPREDISVRAASIQALGMLGNAEAGTTFRQILRENQSILQTLAAFYSCQLRIENNAAIVAELLPTADAEQKRSLISAMGFWPERFAEPLTSVAIDSAEDGEIRALALAGLHELSEATKASLAERLTLALHPNDQVDVQLALIGFLAEVPSPSVRSALKKFSAAQGLNPTVQAALEKILRGSK
jgi:HEAT repeat protein